MKRRLDIVLLMVLAAAIVSVVVATVSVDEDLPQPGATRHDASVPMGLTDAGVGPNDASVGWIAPAFEGRALRAVMPDDASVGVHAHFAVGVAGIFPPLQAEGTQIALPELEAGTPTFEVHATTPDGAHAFWDTVDGEAELVELAPAFRFEVHVTGPAGTAIDAARVRIARAPVALIVESAQTGAGGEAVFGDLVAGSYHLTVEAPGYLTKTQWVDLDAQSASWSVVLDRGARVRGRVLTPQGDPVDGARVLIHVSRAGEQDLRGLVPEAVAETDARGDWSVDSLPAGPTSVTAFADGWAPTSGTTVDTTGRLDPVELDVRLTAGLTATVRVEDAGGTLVPGARIAWRDELSGLGATVVAGENGRATFEGLPPSALFEAAFAEWTSPTVALAAAEDRANVRLVLQRADATGIWRVRLAPPNGIDVWEVQATDSEGARCLIEAIGGLDFALRGCGEGMLTVTAETNAGPVAVRIDAVDGVEVALPAPTSVALVVRGTASEAWNQTSFALEQGRDVLELLPTIEAAQADLRSAVFPGDWQLVVRNQRVGTRRFPVSVATTPVRRAFQLLGDVRLRFWVVDRYDAPVNGAIVLLFDGDRFVDMRRSGGQLPAEFAVQVPWTGTALAVNPRRGEGVVSVEVDGAGEFEERISLSAPVLTSAVPAQRPTREALGTRLGAQLVADGEGVVLDFDRTDAPGIVAGLKRGDRLVTALPLGAQLRVIVYREAVGLVDVVVR